MAATKQKFEVRDSRINPVLVSLAECNCEIYSKILEITSENEALRKDNVLLKL